MSVRHRCILHYDTTEGTSVRMCPSSIVKETDDDYSKWYVRFLASESVSLQHLSLPEFVNGRVVDGIHFYSNGRGLISGVVGIGFSNILDFGVTPGLVRYLCKTIVGRSSTRKMLILRIVECIYYELPNN